MSFTTLAFTHAALNGLARAAGYPDAREALIDLTEPTIELAGVLGDREGGCFVTTFKELATATGESEDWAKHGVSITGARTVIPDDAMQHNYDRARHPDTDRIKALREHGLTAAEIAGVLNRQDRREYWTAVRVNDVAYQMGLTKVKDMRAVNGSGRGTLKQDLTSPDRSKRYRLKHQEKVRAAAQERYLRNRQTSDLTAWRAKDREKWSRRSEEVRDARNARRRARRAEGKSS